MDIIYKQLPFLKLFLLLISIYCFGFIIGVISFVLSKMVYEKTIFFLYGFKPIKAAERLFLFLKPQNRYNVITGLEFEKELDIKAFKELFNERIKMIPRLRQMIARKHYDFWWKEYDYKTALEKLEFEIVTDTALKTREDIYEYMNQESNILFDLEKELPYKLILFSNKDNLKGDVLFFKFDHIFSDGLGYVSLLFGMTDNFSSKDFPLVVKFSIIDRIKAYIFSPFYILLNLYIIYVKCNNGDTPLKNNINSSNLSGKSNKSVSRRFIFPEYSRINKDMKITFNDFMMGVFSKAFYNYYTKDLKLSEYNRYISILVTLGSRNIPTNPNDILLENDSTGVSFCMPLINDPLNIKEMHRLKKDSDRYIKNWAYAYNVRFITDFVSYFCPKWFFYFMLKQTPQDFIFTNLPGPKKAVEFNNNKLIDVFTMSTPGFNPNFIGVITYDQKIRFFCFVDKATKRESKDIIKNIEEVMIDIHRRKYGADPIIED